MGFIFTQYVSDKLSRKILDQALEQQDELQAEYGTVTAKRGKKALAEARTSLGGLSKPGTAGSDDESDSDEDEFSEGEDQYYEDVVSKAQAGCGSSLSQEKGREGQTCDNCSISNVTCKNWHKNLLLLSTHKPQIGKIRW